MIFQANRLQLLSGNEEIYDQETIISKTFEEDLSV